MDTQLLTDAAGLRDLATRSEALADVFLHIAALNERVADQERRLAAIEECSSDLGFGAGARRQALENAALQTMTAALEVMAKVSNGR